VIIKRRKEGPTSVQLKGLMLALKSKSETKTNSRKPFTKLEIKWLEHKCPIKLKIVLKHTKKGKVTGP